MSANEMFKKLGYEIYPIDEPSWEVYRNYEEDTDIIFDKDYKHFCCSTIYENECVFMSIQELDAINQKIKELGWK